MSETRAVPIDAETIAKLEQIGLGLLRDADPRASIVLGICLAWKVSSPVTHSRVFRCEPDESGGLADVIPLDPYSRKV